MICDSLKVPRGTFYNHIFRNKRDNTWYSKRGEEFRIKIQEIYDENNQIFGAAKITTIIKEEGYRISIGMVRELMQDMEPIGIRQETKNLYAKEQKIILIRNLQQPDQMKYDKWYNILSI